jgi:hypothetical protein
MSLPPPEEPHGKRMLRPRSDQWRASDGRPDPSQVQKQPVQNQASSQPQEGPAPAASKAPREPGRSNPGYDRPFRLPRNFGLGELKAVDGLGWAQLAMVAALGLVALLLAWQALTRTGPLPTSQNAAILPLYVDPEPTPAPSPTFTGYTREKRVAVYNGSGIYGMASLVTESLVAQGWTVDATGTWPGKRTKTVLFGSDYSSLMTLAMDLPVKESIRGQIPGMSKSYQVVLVGSDINDFLKSRGRSVRNLVSPDPAQATPKPSKSATARSKAKSSERPATPSANPTEKAARPINSGAAG